MKTILFALVIIGPALGLDNAVSSNMLTYDGTLVRISHGSATILAFHDCKSHYIALVDGRLTNIASLPIGSNVRVTTLLSRRVEYIYDVSRDAKHARRAEAACVKSLGTSSVTGWLASWSRGSESSSFTVRALNGRQIIFTFENSAKPRITSGLEGAHAKVRVLYRVERSGDGTYIVPLSVIRV